MGFNKTHVNNIRSNTDKNQRTNNSNSNSKKSSIQCYCYAGCCFCCLYFGAAWPLHNQKTIILQMLIIIAVKIYMRCVPFVFVTYNIVVIVILLIGPGLGTEKYRPSRGLLSLLFFFFDVIPMERRANNYMEIGLLV